MRNWAASRSDSAETSRSPTCTLPRSGRSTTAASDSNVDLPDPLGPNKATNSPGPTVSETPSTARTVSPPVA